MSQEMLVIIFGIQLGKTCILRYPINVNRVNNEKWLFILYSVDVDSSEHFLHGGELPKLLVQSSGHALHVFVNGEHSGMLMGYCFST